MLVVVPYLSVSHGYLSCTNTDDGLHTHTHTHTHFVHTSLREAFSVPGCYDDAHPTLPETHLEINEELSLEIYIAVNYYTHILNVDFGLGRICVIRSKP
jgi:hypothetical protein